MSLSTIKDKLKINDHDLKIIMKICSFNMNANFNYPDLPVRFNMNRITMNNYWKKITNTIEKTDYDKQFDKYMEKYLKEKMNSTIEFENILFQCMISDIMGYTIQKFEYDLQLIEVKDSKPFEHNLGYMDFINMFSNYYLIDISPQSYLHKHILKFVPTNINKIKDYLKTNNDIELRELLYDFIIPPYKYFNIIYSKLNTYISQYDPIDILNNDTYKDEYLYNLFYTYMSMIGISYKNIPNRKKIKVSLKIESLDEEYNIYHYNDIEFIDSMMMDKDSFDNTSNKLIPFKVLKSYLKLMRLFIKKSNQKTYYIHYDHLFNLKETQLKLIFSNYIFPVVKHKENTDIYIKTKSDKDANMEKFNKIVEKLKPVTHDNVTRLLYLDKCNLGTIQVTTNPDNILFIPDNSLITGYIKDNVAVVYSYFTEKKRSYNPLRQKYIVANKLLNKGLINPIDVKTINIPILIETFNPNINISVYSSILPAPELSKLNYQKFTLVESSKYFSEIEKTHETNLKKIIYNMQEIMNILYGKPNEKSNISTKLIITFIKEFYGFSDINTVFENKYDNILSKVFMRMLSYIEYNSVTNDLLLINSGDFLLKRYTIKSSINVLKNHIDVLLINKDKTYGYIYTSGKHINITTDITYNDYYEIINYFKYIYNVKYYISHSNPEEHEHENELILNEKYAIDKINKSPFNYVKDNIIFNNYEVVDFTLTKEEYLEKILDIYIDIVKQNTDKSNNIKSMFIHCGAGTGRTPTTLLLIMLYYIFSNYNSYENEDKFYIRGIFVSLKSCYLLDDLFNDTNYITNANNFKHVVNYNCNTNTIPTQIYKDILDDKERSELMDFIISSSLITQRASMATPSTHRMPSSSPLPGTHRMPSSSPVPGTQRTSTSIALAEPSLRLNHSASGLTGQQNTDDEDDITTLTDELESSLYQTYNIPQLSAENDTTLLDTIPEEDETDMNESFEDLMLKFEKLKKDAYLLHSNDLSMNGWIYILFMNNLKYLYDTYKKPIHHIDEISNTNTNLLYKRLHAIYNVLNKKIDNLTTNILGNNQQSAGFCKKKSMKKTNKYIRKITKKNNKVKK